MIDQNFYNQLKDASLKGDILSEKEALQILCDGQIEILPLLNATFEVRKKYFGNTVTIHIINNGQNGYCPEDCHYCAQAKSSNADIEEYSLKSDEEFLSEAQNAYEKGAFRYCMVFAGRGPNRARTERLSNLIREIKSRYPSLQICVSAGLLDLEKAQVLKEAGLDRLNHNLNTSQSNYPNICTTHTYVDRLNTLQAARDAGIKLCSGMIAGMQETPKDIVEVGLKLRELKVESIPVNFLIPIEGNKIKENPNLTPEFCLRILCLFRFLNPQSELRVAAGREMHLRSLEVMAFYAANSLFLDGYLNARGNTRRQTLTMLKDAGFEIKSDFNLEELLANEKEEADKASLDIPTRTIIKTLQELRPAQRNAC